MVFNLTAHLCYPQIKGEVDITVARREKDTETCKVSAVQENTELWSAWCVTAAAGLSPAAP